MSVFSFRFSKPAAASFERSAFTILYPSKQNMKTTLILAALFLGASIVSAKDKPDKSDPAAMFKSLDSNKDGAVSKEEFLASKKAQKDTAKAEKHFSKLDANNDGKLTQEEFGAGEKKAEKTPAKPEEKKPDAPKTGDKKPADAK